jgi:threonine aldolase
MAARLQNGILNSQQARLAWPAEANEVFCILPKKHAEQLQAQGAVFYPWHTPQANPQLVRPDEVLVRLVTSFATKIEQVDRFLQLLG